MCFYYCTTIVCKTSYASNLEYVCTSIQFTHIYKYTLNIITMLINIMSEMQRKHIRRRSRFHHPGYCTSTGTPRPDLSFLVIWHAQLGLHVKCSFFTLKCRKVLPQKCSKRAFFIFMNLCSLKLGLV